MTDADHFTAIHEAGHVVAHFNFRETVEKGFEFVTIVPNEELGFAGHVESIFGDDSKNPSCFDFSHGDELNSELAGFDQHELEAILSINLAGEAATFVETGQRDDHGTGRASWSGDFASSMDFLEPILAVDGDANSPGNKAAFHYLETIFWRTVLFLGQPGWWEKIEAIAEALLEKRSLSFEECETIAFPQRLSGFSS